MIVAGGVYIEACLTPLTISLMGSGGRAALAVSGLAADVTLHTFYPPEERPDLAANFAPFGIEVVIHQSPSVVEFSYLHSLSRPRVSPIPLPRSSDAHLCGDLVLRFGCVEASFIVDAKVAIYDPQSGGSPSPFRENGSKAERLAVVLNAHEARLLSRTSDLDDAAASIMRLDSADVVIIKDGAVGAHVFSRHSPRQLIPTYESEVVYKIGSGDVFTAVFAHYWSNGASPTAAADMASRHTAHYVSTRQLPCSKELPALRARRLAGPSARRVYISGDRSTTPNIWLLEEAKQALTDLGADVFACGDKPELSSVSDDLASIKPDTLLALLPTSAEAESVISEAADHQIPVIVFGELKAEVLQARGCFVTADFATALYQTMWGGR